MHGLHGMIDNALFPTRVGMNRDRERRVAPDMSAVPHTRGDEPVVVSDCRR